MSRTRLLGLALLVAAVACSSKFSSSPEAEAPGASGDSTQHPGDGQSDDGGTGAGASDGEGGEAIAGGGDAGQSSIAGASPSGGVTGDDLGGSSGASPSAGAGAVAGSAPSAGAGGAPVTQPHACQSVQDCGAQQNCVANSCTLPLASCSAQKAASAAAKDGIYWIKPASTVERAYCDMALATELCTEVAAEHRGRTRDKAAIPYTMSSLLMPTDSVCKIWALRGTNDGIPFQSLAAFGSVPQGYTCIYLGFLLDGSLGSCNFGSSRSDCGFTIAAFYRYSNDCPGCMVGPGSFDRWTKQGPISVGAILSSMSGSAFTTCKTN